MGLKKENYYSKKYNWTFPSAYALIRDLSIKDDKAHAVFEIQENRDEFFKKEPLGIVNFYFEVNRNESPYITAYKKVKETKQTYIKRINKDNTEEIIKTNYIKMPFADWEDDIEEEK